MTRLQPLTRARVARLGEPGRVWAETLPTRLDDLSRRWDLTLGRPLPGGSASYVVRARTGEGEPRVLKVLAPDPDLADEAPVLRAAGGVGYARLHASEHGALLMEELGASADRSALEPEESLLVLVSTLRLAWRTSATDAGREPLDKASDLLLGLARHLAAVSPAVRSSSARVVGAARELGRDLAASYDPTRAVLAHGDAHAGNLLRRSEREWAFVDPDGLLVEPEYDLGVVLRDGSRRLLEGSVHDARELQRSRVELVADAAGADPGLVARWALLERVTTGLFVCSLGSEAVGVPFLESAERLLHGPA